MPNQPSGKPRGEILTSLLEMATTAIRQTQELHRLPAREEPPNSPENEHSGREYMESLLALDTPGWERLLAENSTYQPLRGRLERLIASWLSHSDYRELRGLAQARTEQPLARATEDIIREWITHWACIRLAFLVAGMRFPDLETPICYAISSACRAVQHEVNYARTPKGFTQEEIKAAAAELQESAEEHMELASLGFEENPAPKPQPTLKRRSTGATVPRWKACRTG